MYRLIGTAETPQEIADALNARRIELRLSQTDLDHATGLASGYCSKLFASNYRKTLGELSLPTMLGALGLRLAIVVDEAPEALPPVTRRIVEERARKPRPVSLLQPRGTRAAQRARRLAAQEAGTA